MKYSDTTATEVDLREDKGDTLWRRLEHTDTAVDFSVNPIPFVTLFPVGGTPVDVVVTVSLNTFEFSIDTNLVVTGTPYEIGWMDLADTRTTLCYGKIVLV